MRQKEGFVLRDVCGEKVIVGEGLDTVDFGKLISLNDSAALLWERAGRLGDFTVQDLADALTEEYEVDAETALADAGHIAGDWLRIGIITAPEQS